jgi:hypothetical protein
VTSGTNTVQQVVSVVSHVDVPSAAQGLQTAMPVKVPPLPIHPKRGMGR